MSQGKLVRIFHSLFIVLIITLGLNQFLFAGQQQVVKADSSLHIDIPIALKKANVVFNMDHLAFAGDVPVGIKYMHLLANRYKQMSTQGKIIGIFHGEAAYMTLNDKAYDTFRHVTTGNPYKGLISELIKQGIQIEECAVSMKAHNWANDNLLPDIKVNGGAVARLIELIQEGYVQIQP